MPDSRKLTQEAAKHVLQPRTPASEGEAGLLPLFSFHINGVTLLWTAVTLPNCQPVAFAAATRGTLVSTDARLLTSPQKGSLALNV